MWLPDTLSDCLAATHTTQIRVLWVALSDEADNVDAALEDTKREFSKTTVQQACVLGSWYSCV